MTHDEIMQALRLTAMGRFGHPLQEQLASKLVEVFAQLPKEHMDGCGVEHEAVWMGPQGDATVCDPNAEVTVQDLSTFAVVPKRRPGAPGESEADKEWAKFPLGGVDMTPLTTEPPKRARKAKAAD